MIEEIPLAECLFLDVGQGTANTVLFPDKSALVFDAGPAQSSVLHDLLTDFDVAKIECVIVSHNDRDHIGGLEELAQRFAGKIQQVILLEDRNYEHDTLFDNVIELCDQGAIPRPMRAEIRQLGAPEVVWQHKSNGVRVEIAYPDMKANIDARRSNSPNKTSVIAMLRSEGGSVVFPGDSALGAWKELKKARSDFPLKVDIFVMPHHGGLLQSSSPSSQMSWLLENAIRASNVVISVGSFNSFGHPRSEHLEVLRGESIPFRCTQLTQGCVGTREDLNNFSSVLGDAVHAFSESHPRYKKNGIGCAGTIVAKLHRGFVALEESQSHEKNVKERVPCPQCFSEKEIEKKGLKAD